MDAAALEARLTRLEQTNAELRQEIQLLRAVPEAKQDAREGEVLSRRGLLTGAAYTLGAVGLSIAGTRSAEASLGTMRYGDVNDAGTSFTSLQSTDENLTLYVLNSSPSGAGGALGTFTYNGTSFNAKVGGTSSTGHAIQATVSGSSSTGNAVQAQADGFGHSVYAVKNTASGHGVLAYQTSTTGLWAAIAGVTRNGGPGLYGRAEGSGQGVWGEINDSSKTQSAVLGSTEGTGAAIEGNSILGRGGVFKGKKAQIRLVASSVTNKPSTGTRGDLFVDSTGRLWYCKTSGSTTGWKQLA